MSKLKHETLMNTRLRCYDCSKIYEKYYATPKEELLDTIHGQYCDECKAKREARK